MSTVGVPARLAREFVRWVHTVSTARLAVAVGLAGTTALALVDLVVRDQPTPRGDTLIYERMAEDPTGTHTYVFAYRIAVPWLVHALPFDHTASFTMLAWVFSGAAGGVLYLLLSELGIRRAISVLLALMLVLSPPLVVASLRQGRSPDPLSVLILVAGALFIVRRQPVPLAVTMLVGALNRESALFLGPLAYAVWADRLWDPAVLRRVVAATAPAVAAFVALRLAIPTVGREAVPGYDSLVGGRLDILEDAYERRWEEIRRVGSAYGPLWLLLPLGLAHERFARRGLVLLGLCVISLLFALDWGRIFILAAPVVYAASAAALERYPRLRMPTLVLGALLVFGYAAYMQLEGVENIIEEPLPPYPVQ